MIKLLRFFAPQIIKGTLFLFALAIIVVLILQILPIASEAKESISALILLLIFPVYCFFNNKFYLPASLGWILLTPVKKRDIVLAHGLINIFKILFVFILINLVALVAAGGDVSKTPAIIGGLFFYTTIWQELQILHLENILFFLTVLLMILALLFGILPSYLQRIQDKQSSGVSGDWKRDKKHAVKVVALVFLGIFGLGFYDSISIYFSGVIKSSAFFSAVLFVVIGSTLASVKYYYQRKIFVAAGVGFFLFSSYFFIQYGLSDLEDKRIGLRDRISILQSLGTYADDQVPTLIQSLYDPKVDSRSLQYQDMQVLFSKADTMAKYLPSLSKVFENQCELANDHYCRLTGFLDILSNKPARLSFLERGCLKDPASCMMIIKHKEATPVQVQLAESSLQVACANAAGDFSGGCREYRRYKEKQVVKKRR